MELRFVPSRLEKVENLENYAPSGYHPVHVGQIFDDGRYRIIHKLGHGASSTVWLVRDLQEHVYAAMKIYRADQIKAAAAELAALHHVTQNATTPGRQYIVELLGSFHIDGPNGRHQCLILQIAGPSIRSFSEAPGKISGYKRLHPQLARSLSRHVTEGLACLHAIGILHGDLTPSNVLVSMDFIQTMSEQELLELIGQPVCEDVHLNNVGRASMSQLPDSAPAYIVAPCDIMAAYRTLRTCRALVTDLNLSHISGVTQGCAALPVEDLGRTSVSYAAPELIFGSQSSFSSDIWSLACVLYAICAGREMFESFFGTEDEVLQQMVQSLGRLPDEMWIRWDSRKHFIAKDGSFQRMSRDVWPLDSLRKMVQDIGVCDEGKDVTEQAPSMTITGDTRLSQEEVAELLELLDKALIYDPAARPTATSLLRCTWLS